jgi:hypothetical protein
LAAQELACQASRNGLKARDGFAKLSGDDQHAVLRPVTQAAHDTTADAVAPTLEQMRDAFPERLRLAVETANDLLDRLFSDVKGVTVSQIRANFVNVEITSEAQLDGLLDDLRTRVKERLARGERVRLV